jgi:hypothetical protein
MLSALFPSFRLGMTICEERLFEDRQRDKSSENMA